MIGVVLTNSTKLGGKGRKHLILYFEPTSKFKRYQVLLNTTHK